MGLAKMTEFCEQNGVVCYVSESGGKRFKLFTDGEGVGFGTERSVLAKWLKAWRPATFEDLQRMHDKTMLDFCTLSRLALAHFIREELERRKALEDKLNEMQLERELFTKKPRGMK